MRAMSGDIISRRQAAEPAVRRFVERSVRSRLRWEDCPVRIEIPEGGARSLLFIARAEGCEPVVIHAFRKSDERRRLDRALALGARHELPVPVTRHKGWAFGESLRYGLSFLVVEHVPGRHLPPEPPDRQPRAALAAALARMHSARSDKWGRPGGFTRKSIREDWARGVARRCREIGQGKLDLNPEVLRSIEARFGEMLESIPEPREFQICHHHLAPDDILYDPETTRVAFIDCSSLQFSRAARDLAAVRHAFFLEDENAWRDFGELYFAKFTQEWRAACELELAFFESFLILGRLRRMSSKPQRARPLLERLLGALKL